MLKYSRVTENENCLNLRLLKLMFQVWCMTATNTNRKKIENEFWYRETIKLISFIWNHQLFLTIRKTIIKWKNKTKQKKHSHPWYGLELHCYILQRIPVLLSKQFSKDLARWWGAIGDCSKFIAKTECALLWSLFLVPIEYEQHWSE